RNILGCRRLPAGTPAHVGRVGQNARSPFRTAGVYVDETAEIPVRIAGLVDALVDLECLGSDKSQSLGVVSDNLVHGLGSGNRDGRNRTEVSNKANGILGAILLELSARDGDDS